MTVSVKLIVRHHTNEAELLRTALQEFIRNNRLKLMEQFMKEDKGYRDNI
jgi:hypothetical protein